MAKKHSFKTPLAFPNKTLAVLALHAKQQSIILNAIRSKIPDELTRSIKYLAVSGSKLQVYTDNAANATKLRFHAPTLISAASLATQAKVLSLQIRITETLRQEYQIRKPRPKLPSMAVIKALKANQKSKSADPLDQALMRLSLTLEKLSKKPIDS
ncbi:MAG: DciA family protein [Methylicorpusculum sp.]|uniref:DciA family protein n=1 Tax=Methylicorpusculum sp. TaxID=2713644 RepID=UPI002718650E|nr:DciA family protein [Methylicorpusculum sp.]MDO8845511.1 DciA family protein [Methylicorpusculum sp.]MDO8938675.1 DciA family protein [Methylicorpusculum sp.]MDP2179268.1 DciA family protein [Methylicorpusculum sp.]MDP2200462.1 DciA family protein [Methylicorpusculum sp.]MDP3530050.1 DciA family protein [Methylicorpusculum sp.]